MLPPLSLLASPTFCCVDGVAVSLPLAAGGLLVGAAVADELLLDDGTPLKVAGGENVGVPVGVPVASAERDSDCEAVPDVAEGVTVVDSEVPAESDAVIVGVCVLAAEAVAEALGATDAEAMGQTSTNRRRRF